MSRLEALNILRRFAPLRKSGKEMCHAIYGKLKPNLCGFLTIESVRYRGNILTIRIGTENVKICIHKFRDFFSMIEPSVSFWNVHFSNYFFWQY